VLTTQRTLLSVQDSLKSSEADRATALVQLYKALGGGWPAPTRLEVPGTDALDEPQTYPLPGDSP
jgi:multidrug efflux system outer membrane protein